MAVAAAVRVEGGTIAEARVGLTNMGSAPLRAAAVEQALVGQPATADAIKRRGPVGRRGHVPAERRQRRRGLPPAPRRRAHRTRGARGRRGELSGLVDLEHDFTVPMPVGDAWAAFNDLELIAPCFPGAVITSVDGDDFTGTAKVKLGPIASMYTGKGSFASGTRRPAGSCIEAQRQGQARQRHRGGHHHRALEEDGAEAPGSSSTPT